MREIKFRAWDKRFKNMDFGSGDLLLRINEQDFSEPMQFTGLLDKNLNEIYEGDILELNIVGGRDGSIHKYFEVYWNEITAMYLDNKTGDPLYLISDCTRIIGNIYKNPDLIK